jgi:hypothetical protein
MSLKISEWKSLAASRDKLKYTATISRNGKNVAFLEKTSNIEGVLNYELNITPGTKDIDSVMNLVISLIAHEFQKYIPFQGEKKLEFNWNTSYPARDDVRKAFQIYNIELW